MTAIGYARCSSQGQSYDGQIESLVAAGCERTFAEKASGAKSDRPELARALAALRPGDTLIVARLDRLSRSTIDLLTTLDRVTKAGAGFKSLADPWCDTTTPTGRLMVTFIGGFAEFERSLIVSRTSEGRVRAMARGVKFGPRPKLNPDQLAFARQRHQDPAATFTDTAKLLGVSRQTIMRAIT